MKMPTHYMKNSTQTILLIDGDILIYRAAAAVEKVIVWEEDSCFPIASLAEAMAAFESQMDGILDHFKTKDPVIALSHLNNFRTKVYPAYKANRIDKPKPVARIPLQQWVAENYYCYQRPGLEADDVLGILSTSTKILPKDQSRIIVSLDKDMQTIPGQYYNYKHDILYNISQQDADYYHMLQTLIGDTADGYPGCPGIGPKKAEAILSGLTSYEEMWPAVVAAFDKAGLSAEQALTQARIARICRVTDYNFKKKEVKLWQPPVSDTPPNLKST